MKQSDIDIIPDALADVLGLVIAEQRLEWQRELRAITAEAQAAIAEMKLAAAPEVGRIAILERRLGELSDRGLLYKGVWQASGSYERGSVVTHAGGIWHANAPDTRDEPGKSRNWQLMVKSAAAVTVR